MEHWLAVEAAARRSAARHLPPATVAMLSLEALARRPRAVVSALLTWIVGDGGDSLLPAGVMDADAADDSLEATGWHERPEAADWVRSVRTDPNARYVESYASALEASERAREQHAAMVATFEQRVATVSGYSLREVSRYGAPPQRSDDWWRRWYDEGVSEFKSI